MSVFFLTSPQVSPPPLPSRVRQLCPERAWVGPRPASNPGRLQRWGVSTARWHLGQVDTGRTGSALYKFKPCFDCSELGAVKPSWVSRRSCAKVFPAMSTFRVGVVEKAWKPSNPDSAPSWTQAPCVFRLTFGCHLTVSTSHRTLCHLILFSKLATYPPF